MKCFCAAEKGGGWGVVGLVTVVGWGGGGWTRCGCTGRRHVEHLFLSCPSTCDYLQLSGGDGCSGEGAAVRSPLSGRYVEENP